MGWTVYFLLKASPRTTLLPQNKDILEKSPLGTKNALQTGRGWEELKFTEAVRRVERWEMGGGG